MSRMAAVSSHVLPSGSIDVSALAESERDNLVATSVVVENSVVVLSRFGDQIWAIPLRTTNSGRRAINFTLAPQPFRLAMKIILWRYMHVGREGRLKPSAASVRALFVASLPFLRYLALHNIYSFKQASPIVLANFVEMAKKTNNSKGRPPSRAWLCSCFQAIETIAELSVYAGDPFPLKPWPDSSGAALAGYNKAFRSQRAQTAVIPDAVLESLFTSAVATIGRAAWLLDRRDEMSAIASEWSRKGGRSADARRKWQTRHLREHGWQHGMEQFGEELLDIRDACYIVVATLSGCRNHELAFVQTQSWRGTTEEGERFWWMQSKSTKTGVGDTEWMIPELAVNALKIMDRWSEPLRDSIRTEIAERKARNPHDPEIAEATRHINAVFLGETKYQSNQVRTLGSEGWNGAINRFARRRGLSWRFTSHQFRRTFAVYAARSTFGDLRYLKEHFKHWSMDMTLLYALNDLQELELFEEVSEELDAIQQGVLGSWLDPDEPLSGGAGRNIVRFRQEHPIQFYASRADMVRSVCDTIRIRANGHAWCTADSDDCVGNGGLERVRCSDCNNGVIGRQHAPVYRGIYSQQQELLKLDDIGEGGLLRVKRDLERCEQVLEDLGDEQFAIEFDGKKKAA